jgi:HSP20 family protein
MAVPTRRPSSPLAQRSDPFREFSDLQSQMEQLLESVWSGAGAGTPAIWAPPVDIEETEDAWIIEAELPGAKHDDVHVELRDSELVISGEIKERERQGILRRRTRRVGQFEYRVVLPGEPDGDNVDASLDGGVLRVRVPKAERNRPREIQVTGGQNGQSGQTG